MELVLFEQVGMGERFVHNNLDYRRVSQSYAEMDSRFLTGTQNFYFRGTTQVRVPRQKKV